MAVIATVGKVQGEVFAVDASGARRRLREGDRIQEGETIVTGAGSTVELTFVSGRTITVPEQQTFVADASVGGQDLPDTRSAGVVPPTVITTDPNQLIEQDATAAGLTGGGGGGTTFVQLLRIAELGGVPNVYAFGPNVFPKLPGTPSGVVQDNPLPATTGKIVAANDANSVSEGVASASAPVAGVLANDTGTPITVTAIRTGTEAAGAGVAGTVGLPLVGTHGTLTLNANGSYTYALNNASPLVQLLAPGETLTDVFTYTMGDASERDRAELVITIVGSDDLPLAVADTNAIAEEAVPGSVSGSVRTNDTPGDGTLAQNVFALNGSATGAFGTLVFNADGSYVYALNNAAAAVQRLAPGDTLTDVFSYTLTDRDGDVSLASLVITINGADDLPIARADAAAIAEDAAGSTVSGSVRTNDTLGDGTAAQNVVALTGGATGTYGSLALSGDGSYVYTLANALAAVQQLTQGEMLTDTFGYRLTDKDGDVSTANLVVTITGTDDLPVALADAATIAEDAASLTVGGSVRTNDTLGDGTAAQNLVVLTSSPTGTYGSLALNGDGSYVYTFTANASAAVQQLAPGESLTDTFGYTLTDKDGDASSANLVVTIAGADDLPLARADAAAIPEDAEALTVSGNVRTNDTPGDGTPAQNLVSLTGSATGTYGSLALNADGSYVYTLDNAAPAVQSLGAGTQVQDTFAYQLTDKDGDASPATLVVTITGVNDPPVANPDARTTNEDRSITIAAADLLANDTDADAGDTKTLVSVQSAVNGAVFMGEGGSVVFSPNPNFNGAASFTYTMRDAAGATSTATVDVTVNPVNDAPFAVNDTFNGTEDVVLTITSAGLFDADGTGTLNDHDIDSASFNNIQIVTPSSNEGLGQLLLSGTPVGMFSVISAASIAAGNLTFAPNPNASGATVFYYTVSDGELYSGAALVSIAIAPANDPPVANPDARTTSEDTPITIAAADLLTNDTDADAGDTKTFLSVQSAVNGTVSLGAGNDILFTPAGDFNGSATFTYTMRDTAGATGTATVTVTVNPVNDAPTTAPDANYVVFRPADPSGGADGNAQDAVGNVLQTLAHGPYTDQADSDVDANDTLEVVPATVTGKYGILTLNADGGYTYDYRGGGPNGGDADVFSYSVTDGTATTNTGSLVINILHAPVANDDSNAAGSVFVGEGGGGSPFQYLTSTDGNVLETRPHPGFFFAAGDVADTDADGDSLEVTAIRTGPEGGTGTAGTLGQALSSDYGSLTMNSDGSYTFNYDQSADSQVDVFFTYTVSDGLLTDVGTLKITISDGSN